MAYLASIHKASSVRHAVKANFLSPKEQSLIIGKSSRIEIYSFERDGLSLKSQFQVYGRITALLTLRPADSPTDHLFVATDNSNYFTVSWDPVVRRVRNEHAACDVSDKFLRKNRCGSLYVADPAGRLLGLHVYQGTFLSIPLAQPPKKGMEKKSSRSNEIETPINFDTATPIRFSELDVLDMAFLYETEYPVLAILHNTSCPSLVQMKTYEITHNGTEFKEWHMNATALDAESKLLIPVPGPFGGLLVIGAQVVYYFAPGEPALKYILHQVLAFVAWGVVDAQRYLLGDEGGKLHILFLELEHGKVHGVKVEELGQVSIPSRLVYLDDGHVYVGSHGGDSQLVRLCSTGPKTQVIETFTNLAPITDFRVIDMYYSSSEGQLQQYSSGHMRIISGSGGFRQGSLRSVKSGVGMEDLGILGDMVGIRGLWGLKSNPASAFDDVLVVSFVGETRIFRFYQEDDPEELDNFNGFSLRERTLVSGNVTGGKLLQVTTTSALLVDTESGALISGINLSANQKISMASANEDTLIYVVEGSTLFVADLTTDFKEVSKRSFSNEIACLTIPSAPSKVCVVGQWTISAVSLLTLPTLETLSEECLAGVGSVAIPRSLLLANILEDQPPTLLVAMGDGTIFTFKVNEDYSLSQKKSIILGTQPVYFQPIPLGNGLVNVLATCDHPSLIYGLEGRIAYSAVTAEKTTHVTPFNAQGFPNSVAVATEEDLRLAILDFTPSTHVRNLSTGDVVRRVAHSKKRNVFGVLTINLYLDKATGDEHFKCHVRVVDEIIFTILDSYRLQEMELVESIVCANLANGDRTFSERFIVGTGYQEYSKDVTSKGRILVFELSDDKKLKLATELIVRGSCKCLEIVNGKIVAALNKTVEIYSWESSLSMRHQIVKVASYRVHSEPIDLGVRDNMIVVGDLMKGPSLLEYSKGENGSHDSLKEVARNYQTLWTTAVELWNKDSIISGDAEGNISIWKRDIHGVTDEDQRRLQLVGDIRVGELINRIRKVDEHVLPGCVVQPKAYCATVDGSIYLLGEIDSGHLDLLIQLQVNMSKVINGVGDLDFNKFRAYCSPSRSSEEPYRFVDGDFIERFLELAEEDAERVINGVGKYTDCLSKGVDEVRSLVEGLKRLH